MMFVFLCFGVLLGGFYWFWSSFECFFYWFLVFFMGCYWFLEFLFGLVSITGFGAFLFGFCGCLVGFAGNK